jgi:hypothetical protein
MVIAPVMNFKALKQEVVELLEEDAKSDKLKLTFV